MDDLFIYAIAPHEFDANDESTAIQIENGILSLKTQQRERQRQRHRERQTDRQTETQTDRQTETERFNSDGASNVATTGQTPRQPTGPGLTRQNLTLTSTDRVKVSGTRHDVASRPGRSVTGEVSVCSQHAPHWQSVVITSPF